MPDLLGATNHVPGYDKAINNRNVQIPTHQNPQLQNVPDLTKVSRADQRTEQQKSDLQGNGNIRYDSNFQTFLQRLKEAPSLTDSLMTLFSGREGTVVLSGMQEGIATEMAQILEMLRMDESQLRDFLLGQVRSGSVLNDKLCALLRKGYARADSDSVKNDILQFLKSYGDHLSSAHIEKNLQRTISHMSDTIPGRWAENLRNMLAVLQNTMASGDRWGALGLLQKKIFPFMAGYIEQTHDMGIPRQLLSQLALDIVRYENGSPEKVLALFHQLKGYNVLKGQLQLIDDDILMKLLETERNRQEPAAMQFSDKLAETAGRALRGEGSQQVQQGFQNLVAAMLVNESVYMPLNHYILPLEWNGRMLFSELWVDPDSERENENASQNPENNVRRILIKVDVQSVGLFDIVLLNKRDDVDIQIACPEKVAVFRERIQKAVAEILVRNSLHPSRVSVSKMERPVTLTEVFPKIFQGRNSINVKA